MMKNRIMLGLMLLVVGCGGDGEAPKTSLFEDDHLVAPHWPSDMEDLAEKLRERLESSPMEPQTLSEINDLVSWTSEVAADTNLSEADWIPVNDAATAMAANLQVERGELTAEDRAQLERMCQIVEQASGTVPQVLTQYSGTSQ